MHRLEYAQYETDNRRRGIAIACAIGFPVLGMMLFVMCALQGLLSAPFVLGFPFPTILMMAFANTPAELETTGVLFWLCAPLQFVAYGALLGWGIRRPWYLWLVWGLAVCHLFAMLAAGVAVAVRV